MQTGTANAMGDIHEFSGFRVDGGQRRLTDASGKPISLSSRAFDLLAYFVDRPGELLDKATLIREIWPDTVVEENNLNQVITSLRKALGDSPKQPRYVATEAGRGYRFIAAVKASVDSEVPDEAQVTDLPSVAVLPFVDMSPGRDQEYFSDGITEELISHLSKLGGLHVAGRTSSFAFKNQPEDIRVIAEKLSVAHILEGSVRKAGDRVRIAVQLVKASDGYRLWSESFDRVLDDIFAIQDEIAEQVATALSVTLGVGDVDLGAGTTRNFDAYDAYLVGRSLGIQEGRENTESAIEHFERAIQLDLEFANAWGALSHACFAAAEAYVPERAAELYSKADQSAERAAEVAPDAVSSLIAMGSLHMRHRRWQEADQAFRRAIELSPTDAFANGRYGVFLTHVGRARDAFPYQDRAFRAEPLSLLQARQLGHVLEITGDLDRAMDQYQLATTLSGSKILVDASMMVLAMEMGDHRLVKNLLSERLTSESFPSDQRLMGATMQSLLDSPNSAINELRRMRLDPTFDNPYVQNAISVWALYFGDPEMALDIWQELPDTRFTSIFAFWRPIYREMRRLSGFKDVLRVTGLVDYWRSTGNWGDFCRPVGDDDFECG